jgi:hypothetical protein
MPGIIIVDTDHILRPLLSPSVIAQNGGQLRAGVDLTGQICAYTIGARRFSGLPGRR